MNSQDTEMRQMYLVFSPPGLRRPSWSAEHEQRLKAAVMTSATWFTNSCGQSYTRMSNFGSPNIDPRQRNTTGAHFIVGKHGDEVDNETEKLTHVKTKAGILTVHIFKKR